MDSLRLSSPKSTQAFSEPDERCQSTQEDLLTGILGLAGGWYWEQDTAFRFTKVAGNVDPNSGPDLQFLLGQTLWDGDLVLASETEQWDDLRVALTERKPFTDLLVTQLESRNQRRYLKISGHPVLDAAARFLGYRGVIMDVTGTTRAEQLLRLEHTVTSFLAGATDAPSALTAVIKAVCQTQEWNCGRYFHVDKDAEQLRFSVSWNVADPTVDRFVADSREVTFRKGAGLNGLVWQSGKPVWVADLSNDPRVQYVGLHRSANTRGAFLFPVFVEGSTVGVLGFNSREVREPDERLLRAAVVIGSQIGQFLQRKQAEEAQRRFRLALDDSGDFILLIDPRTGRFVDVSDAACRDLGFTREEMLAMGPADIDSRSKEDLQQLLRDIPIDGAHGPIMRSVYHCKDGTALTVEECFRSTSAGSERMVVCIARNITERRNLEHALARKNSILATQQETSLDAILLVDENARIVSFNNKFVEMWGIPEQMARAGDDDMVLERAVAQLADPQAFIARVKWLYEHREERSREEIKTRDGRILDRFTAPVVDSDGEYYGRVWYFRDITESRNAEISLRRANRAMTVIGAVNQALIHGENEKKLLDTACRVLLDQGGYRLSQIDFVDHYSGITLRNAARGVAEKIAATRTAEPAAADESGVGPAIYAARTGMVQVNRNILSDPQLTDSRADALAHGYESITSVPLSADSVVFAVLTIASAESDAFDAQEVALLQELAENLSFGIGIQRSNVEHNRAVARAERLSLFDALTELPNRTQLLDDIGFTAREANPESGGFSLLAIDLPIIEDLKTSMGFGASDMLAMAIASRLKEVCTEGEIAARLEGGEFAVRLDPETSGNADSAVARAQIIRSALQLPSIVGTTEVVPRCVIGIAMYPADASDAPTLLERAQTARISTSSGHGNDISFFGLQKSACAMRELSLESALRYASNSGELQLVYQPEVDLRSGEIVAVEALLRWNSRQFGAISPAEFIPLAERTDLILSIGDWVLREACRQAAAWRSAGLSAPRIGINLSSRQLSQPGIAAHIQAIALECGADPSWLGLEITESMLIDDSEHAARVLRELKAIGFEISLDDFGTGYSSLSRLLAMPIDIVKIDRTFVPDVTAEPGGVSVTRAIITMAHSLQMRVLAEGVENEGQLSLLATNGCDLIQGYYFSKPVTPEILETMVRENRCLPEKFLSNAACKRTLLLVDDEENILASLRRLLRRDGYHIVCAHSAAEGLQRLGESPVDVIVSDQRMPGMTGVEFLRRAKDLYPSTIRMVLSGFTDLQSIIDAVNEGAIYKFLTKPWDDERIREHISEAFRQKEMADENRRLTREVEGANSSLARLNDQLQKSLEQQSGQSDILQRSARSAREILDNIPAAIIGVAPDGLLAFVNGSAHILLPDLPAGIGRPARSVLPQSLAALLEAGNSASELTIDRRRFHAVIRAALASDSLQGQLVVLIPADVFGKETPRGTR